MFHKPKLAVASEPLVKVDLQELDFFVNWLSLSFAHGKWGSHFLGRGFDYQGVVPYLEDPDPARINWPATQISGELQVSQYREEHNISIYLICDLAAPMAFGSRASKLERMAFVAALFAYTAYRTKDRCRFVGSGDDMENSFPEPGTKDYPELLYQAVCAFDWEGKKRGELSKAVELLPQGRSMVVIISDFLGDLAEIEKAFDFIADSHEVLPIVLWDKREQTLPDGFGFPFLPLADLESGEMRWFWRGSAKQALERNSKTRLSQIKELCRRFGFSSVLLMDHQQTDLEVLRQYFSVQKEGVT